MLAGLAEWPRSNHRAGSMTAAAPEFLEVITELPEYLPDSRRALDPASQWRAMLLRRQGPANFDLCSFAKTPILLSARVTPAPSWTASVPRRDHWRLRSHIPL
jgi:hypothetical protein